jgi:hypothetical protein
MLGGWCFGRGAPTLSLMVVFGKWPLWIVIGLMTFAIAAPMAVAGNVVLAAALVIVVVIAAYYSLRGDTNY